MATIFISLQGADENLERVLSGLIENVLVKNGFKNVESHITDSLGRPVNPEHMEDGARVLHIRQPVLAEIPIEIISGKTE